MIKPDDIAILVLTIQKYEKNKTTRYLDRNNFDDYYVMIPKSMAKDATGYDPDKIVIYDDEKIKERVDFCGTDIKSGASVGRLACNDWIKKRPGYKVAVVLDDDYGGVVSDYTTTPTLNNKTFYDIVGNMYELSIKTNLELGGYSGGAMPDLKKNIMNVWLITKDTEDIGLDKVLNEDVAHSIMMWQRGKANFGMANVIRIGAQTAEMEKYDGNTKMIYATDRSYRKSFGAILADPNNAKLAFNSGNTKRGALWHHKVSWSKIAPMIILED